MKESFFVDYEYDDVMGFEEYNTLEEALAAVNTIKGAYRISKGSTPPYKIEEVTKCNGSHTNTSSTL